MNVLETVLAGVVGIVGLVIFYTIYNAYSSCLGAAAPLIALVPISIAAGIIIFILYRSFNP